MYTVFHHFAASLFVASTQGKERKGGTQELQVTQLTSKIVFSRMTLDHNNCINEVCVLGFLGCLYLFRLRGHRVRVRRQRPSKLGLFS